MPASLPALTLAEAGTLRSAFSVRPVVTAFPQTLTGFAVERVLAGTTYYVYLPMWQDAQLDADLGRTAPADTPTITGARGAAWYGPASCTCAKGKMLEATAGAATSRPELACEHMRALAARLVLEPDLRARVWDSLAHRVRGPERVMVPAPVTEGRWRFLGD